MHGAGRVNVRRLKERGTAFNVRGNIHMESQNCVIFSLQIITDNHQYDILS